MNRFCRLFLFMLMCGGLLFAAVPASAGDGTQTVQEKAPAHPAKKWRVAYIEGGGYTDYQRILAATAKSLPMAMCPSRRRRTTPGPFGTGSPNMREAIGWCF